MGEVAPPFEELGYFRTSRQLQVELNEGEPRQVTSSSGYIMNGNVKGHSIKAQEGRKTLKNIYTY
jgi:hypothetical protein